MDPPQVQVPGSENPDSQDADPNSNSTEVEMGGTQETTNDTVNLKPTGSTKQSAAAPEDAILPDAQPEPEPPTPAKKNAGFKFLE